jgi:hypothetical protein
MPEAGIEPACRHTSTTGLQSAARPSGFSGVETFLLKALPQKEKAGKLQNFR